MVDLTFVAFFVTLDDAIATDGQMTFSARFGADIAVLYFAERAATVIGLCIAVIAFLVSGGDAVAAFGDIAVDFVGADPAGLDQACGGASVAVHAVSVVT